MRGGVVGHHEWLIELGCWCAQGEVYYMCKVVGLAKNNII